MMQISVHLLKNQIMFKLILYQFKRSLQYCERRKNPYGFIAMQSYHLKNFAALEISLILMCCVPADRIALNNRLVSLPIIFTLAVLVIFLSVKRLSKRSRTDRKSRLLLIFEIMGSVLLCTVYGFVYDEFTPDNVVNLVFVLGSLVFLIPFIAEIATARENQA